MEHPEGFKLSGRLVYSKDISCQIGCCFRCHSLSGAQNGILRYVKLFFSYKRGYIFVQCLAVDAAHPA
jgi:hypothetical protein